MTTDQKIDEVLKIVREQGDQLSSLIQQQAGKSEERDDELHRLIREEREESKARHQELLEQIREERGLNNSRFTQVSTAIMDLRKDMDVGFAAVNVKIDKVHESLSADINAFGDDLYATKRRVTRLEKKLLS